MPMENGVKKTAGKKIINAWAMYDWANSSYSLVITSAIFPIYFHKIVTAGGSETVQFMGRAFNSASLLTYALSGGFLVIGTLSPLLSSLGDYSGRKKAFMFFFCTLGSVACSSLFFFDSTDKLAVGFFGFILAAIGFSGSIVFYNAFLPEIVAPEAQDRVSARRVALAYICSSLLLIFYLTSFVSTAYLLAEGFAFIHEPPSGVYEDLVLIRLHDYVQFFQSVQLLQWNSRVKFNVTVYLNMPTTRDSIVTA